MGVKVTTSDLDSFLISVNVWNDESRRRMGNQEESESWSGRVGESVSESESLRVTESESMRILEEEGGRRVGVLESPQ